MVLNGGHFRRTAVPLFFSYSHFRALYLFGGA
jgi:hypothetical protein